MNRQAIISNDGRYRVSLARWHDPECKKPCCAFEPKREGFLCFLLNNPSNADHNIDDPTVRRLWDFMRRWGYGAFTVLNTNPYRSSDPDAARAHVPAEEIMQINDSWIDRANRMSAQMICGWGDKAHPDLARRAVGVLKSSAPNLVCFDETKAGNPKHPLYIPAAAIPKLYNPSRYLQ